MRLTALVALVLGSWAALVQAEQILVFDTDATIDAGHISTCLRRPHDDPRHCIGLEATACSDRPSDAPNASVAATRCAYAEMNFWQGLMEDTVALLTQNLRGASLQAFQDQQSQWQKTATLCDFPYNVIQAPLWPEAEATRCELRRLAERALQVKSYVMDYLDTCEFPASDLRPGFTCKP